MVVKTDLTLFNRATIFYRKIVLNSRNQEFIIFLTCEVDDGDLYEDLGHVMWVRKLAGHVEPKVLIIINITVTQPDQQSSTL